MKGGSVVITSFTAAAADTLMALEVAAVRVPLEVLSV